MAFIKNLKASLPNYSMLFAMLADLIYYGLLSLTIILAIPNLIMPKVVEMFARLNQIQQIPDYLDAPGIGFSSVILYISLFIIVLTAAYSFFKGVIWLIAIKKDFKISMLGLVVKRLWLKLFIIGIIMNVVFYTIFYAGLYLFLDELFPIYLIIMIALFAHLANVIYPTYVAQRKDAFYEAFYIAFKKIHYFLLPYLVMFAVFALLFFIMANLNIITLFVPAKIFYLLMVLVGVLYSCWTKFYTVRILESIK